MVATSTCCILTQGRFLWCSFHVCSFPSRTIRAQVRAQSPTNRGGMTPEQPQTSFRSLMPVCLRGLKTLWTISSDIALLMNLYTFTVLEYRLPPDSQPACGIGGHDAPVVDRESTHARRVPREARGGLGAPSLPAPHVDQRPIPRREQRLRLVAQHDAPGRARGQQRGGARAQVHVPQPYGPFAAGLGRSRLG